MRSGYGDLLLDFRSAAVSSKNREGLWAIEIKRSSTPSVSKGFHIGCADIRAKRKLVVYPGDSSFSLGQKIEAIGLLDLVRELRALAV